MNKYCPSCFELLQEETVVPDYHYYCNECSESYFDFEAVDEVNIHQAKCRRYREILDEVYDNAVNVMDHFKDQAYSDKYINDLDYIKWLIEVFEKITYLF
jgi:hypothetical protein